MGQLGSYRVFETTDAYAGQQFATQVWERNRTNAASGPYGLRWNYLALSQTDFSYVEQQGPAMLQAEGPLSDNFRLYLHRRGAIEHIVNGRHFRSDTTSIVAHAPGSDLKARLFPFGLLIVGFNGGTVRDALQDRFRRIAPPQDWVGALATTPGTEALRGTIDWLTTELDRPGSPLARPGKPRNFAEHMLASLFIECLVETAPGEAEPALDIGEAHVRRAEAWIEANLSEPIGVQEIARAIGVGVRSLQISFRRRRGCSPSESITKRRLEAARRSLLRADDDSTVTRIAADFGFFELGRFSRRYREHFGESPSATLARCTGAKSRSQNS